MSENHLARVHMSLLNKLTEPETISSFISKKRDVQKMSEPELDEMLELLDSHETQRILQELSSGVHVFPIPNRVEISKSNSSKIRVVYTFDCFEKISAQFIGKISKI